MTDMEEHIATVEAEAGAPVQSPSDVDLLRRVIDLLTEGH